MAVSAGCASPYGWLLSPQRVFPLSVSLCLSAALGPFRIPPFPIELQEAASQESKKCEKQVLQIIFFLKKSLSSGISDDGSAIGF